MLARDLFFKEAIKHNKHLDAKWCFSAMSVTRNNKDPLTDYDIRYTKEGCFGYLNGNSFKFEEVQVNKAFMDCKERLGIVTKDDLININGEVDATYGDFLFNARTLAYALGDKIGYKLGIVNVEDIENEVARRVIDDPIDGDYKEGEIYIRDLIKLGDAFNDLTQFTTILTPSATRKSMTPNERVMALRDELLKKNADNLHDPATIAAIQDELVSEVRKDLKGDPFERFVISGKTWDTALKRMFVIHGPESGFEEGVNAELIVNSLEEGWDISKFTPMVNSLRAGSYYRGALTALGGEAVKFYMRIFQNTMITVDDCGTTLGTLRRVTPASIKNFIGMYEIGKDGSPEYISDDTLKGRIGEYIYTRSSGFCKTPLGDYCKICAGKDNAENPLGVSASINSIGSANMYVMMKAAHAKALKTVPLLYDTFLS